jgi:glutathione S-transferase
MLTLYDNAFSPFARKVRLVLEHKGLAHEAIDGLAIANRERLAAVNGRIEVPALEHDGLVVVGSADIAQYLERICPEPPIYPSDPVEWAQARAWERCADTAIDPILINLSYWMWAERTDTQPEAWLAAARRDMAQVYGALERDLSGRDFIAGSLSIADIALFPHLTATRMFGVGHDPDTHPQVHAWLKRLRAMPLFERDLSRTKAFLASMATENVHEKKKIFYRGDRIEWLLANGFSGWLAKEIAEDRVLWPGFAVPSTAVRKSVPSFWTQS